MIEIYKSSDDLARQEIDVLVPTMGALHAGHASLIKIARQKGKKVLVSIFINPFTEVSAGKVGELYEGKSRPKHFNGVLTVVKRLFELTTPKMAIFGEKDFQQLFLIKQMVKELSLPVDVISAPTIRDENGLALSSRNIFLDQNQKKYAQVIFRALQKSSIEDMNQEILSEPNFRLDYLEVIDENTFHPADKSTLNKRAIIAGWINQVRLIDNMTVSAKS